MNTIDKVEKEIDGMEKLMVKHSGFGASDTEPDGQFQWLLVRFFKGAEVNPTREGWELYSSKAGWGKVADSLTKKALRVRDAINAVPRTLNQELEKKLRNYTWRIDW